MKQLLSTGALIAICAWVSSSSAETLYYQVYARENAAEYGSPLPTISLLQGEIFKVTVDPDDLWSAGWTHRWSNADGLTRNFYATGSDDSGYPAGTLIGVDWGTWTINGFTAPFGTLVGRINSDYMILGTQFTGAAPSSGTLYLMYWDGESSSNEEFVTAAISIVPEPSAALLLLLGGIGILCRSKHA